MYFFLKILEIKNNVTQVIMAQGHLNLKKLFT